MAASNLVEPGENVLVLNTGYFGDSFAECLSIYGANVDQLGATVGDKPTVQQIEEALQKKKYKMLTFTHVDTSTGVLSNAKEICAAVKRVSPDTLTALDGVCSVGSEEIRMDDWGVDVVRQFSDISLGLCLSDCGLFALLGHRRIAEGSRCSTWSLRRVCISQSYRCFQSS